MGILLVVLIHIDTSMVIEVTSEAVYCPSVLDAPLDVIEATTLAKGFSALADPFASGE